MQHKKILLKALFLICYFVIVGNNAFAASVLPDSLPCNGKENPKLIYASTVFSNINSTHTNPITKKRIPTADLSCLKNITGTKRHSDEGLRINVPKDRMVLIESLEISNVRYGLMKYGEGTLYIKNLKIHNFGEDAFRIHASNVYIGNYQSINNTPTFPYGSLTVSEKVHSDKEQLKAIYYEIKETIRDVPPKVFTKIGNKYAYENGHVDAGFQAYKCTNSNVHVDWGGSGTEPTIVLPENLGSMASVLSDDNNISPEYSIELLSKSLKSVGNRFIYLNDEEGVVKNIELNDGVFDAPVLGKYYRFNFSTTEVSRIDAAAFVPISAKNCLIENIYIPSVTIKTNHRISQIFALTDKTDFNNFNIGTTSLNISGIYLFWLNASVLRNSTFGNKNHNGVNITCNKKFAEFPKIPTVKADFFEYRYRFKEVDNEIVCRHSIGASATTGLGVKINNNYTIGQNSVSTKNVNFVGITKKAFSSSSSELKYK